jgi:hypothetical protein
VNDRLFLFIWWLMFVISIAVLVAVGYVAYHFIGKYW